MRLEMGLGRILKSVLPSGQMTFLGEQFAWGGRGEVGGGVEKETDIFTDFLENT